MKLGVKPAPIGREEFIHETIAEIKEISEELIQSKFEFNELKRRATKRLCLGDPTLFRIRSGTRVTNTQVRDNPGTIPVYSCFTDRHTVKGEIAENYLRDREIHIEDPNRTIITIAANGAVGTVFTRMEKCMITDDLIAVEVLDCNIDPEYLAVELRRSISREGHSYEAKLFKTRVEKLTADIPVNSAGKFEVKAQKEIARAHGRLDTIREKLHEIGKRSRTARIN